MVDRNGEKYQQLLNEVFLALSRNIDFRKALLATKDAKLIHTIGNTSPYKTVLTADEFCSRLMVLRKIIKTHYASESKIIVPKRRM